MLMVKKQKPVECRQWTGENFDEIHAFASGFVAKLFVADATTYLLVRTTHGDEVCNVGDYVFKRAEHNFYPLPAAYVAENYERTDNLSNKGEVHDHKVPGKGGGADNITIVFFDEKGQERHRADQVRGGADVAPAPHS